MECQRVNRGLTIGDGQYLSDKEQLLFMEPQWVPQD